MKNGITVSKAAERLELSENHVRLLIRDGVIGKLGMFGRAIVVDERTLHAAEQRNKKFGPKGPRKKRAS